MASAASSKETWCFLRFEEAFLGSGNPVGTRWEPGGNPGEPG
jgi:hypothetical protein